VSTKGEEGTHDKSITALKHHHTSHHITKAPKACDPFFLSTKLSTFTFINIYELAFSFFFLSFVPSSHLISMMPSLVTRL